MRGLVAGILASLISTSGISSPFSLEKRSLAQKEPLPVSRSHPSNLWLVHHQRFTKIRGKLVENRDGQELGEVEDTIVDLNLGTPRYVVISFGGWLGIGRSSRAVPAQLASTATAKYGVVSLDTGRRRWQRAPLFKSSDLTYLNTNPEAVQSLDQYYTQPPLKRGRTMATPAPETSAAPTPTGRRETGKVRLASAHSLLGDRIISRTGETVGKVSDIVIDFSGRLPTFLIVTDDQRLSGHDHVAVPLAGIEFQTPGTLVVEATRESFRRAPLLDDTRWKSTQSTPPLILYRFNVSKNPRAPETNPVKDSRVASARLSP